MKEKKEHLICRFVDPDLTPVTIKSGWNIFSVKLGRTGKIYKGKSYAISGLKKCIKKLKTLSNKNSSIILDDGTLKRMMTKEDMVAWLLKMKIQIFRISEEEDILFYLDKFSDV